MTHPERAERFWIEHVSPNPTEQDITTTAAAFAEVEREALEKAEKNLSCLTVMWRGRSEISLQKISALVETASGKVTMDQAIAAKDLRDNACDYCTFLLQEMSNSKREAELRFGPVACLKCGGASYFEAGKTRVFCGSCYDAVAREAAARMKEQALRAPVKSVPCVCGPKDNNTCAGCGYEMGQRSVWDAIRALPLDEAGT